MRSGSPSSADSGSSSEYKIEWLSEQFEKVVQVTRFWVEWKRVSCKVECNASEAVLT